MECPSCGYENREGARYCNLCLTSFVKEQPKASSLMMPPSPKGNVPGMLRRETEELNWFNQHLNWTWVLAQVTTSVIISVLGAIFAFSLTTSPFTNGFNVTSAVTSVLIIGVIAIILYVLSVYVVGGWVLKRKSRSLWWLLLFLIPLPFVAIPSSWPSTLVGLLVTILFLRLENRSGPAHSAPATAAMPDARAIPGPAEPRLRSAGN
jgi:lysylphosphatidylglycerol synthetase-like protein (DUF2156 family)